MADELTPMDFISSLGDGGEHVLLDLPRPDAEHAAAHRLDKSLIAVHESGHLVACSVEGVRPSGVRIDLSGSTAVGGGLGLTELMHGTDRQPVLETSSMMMSRMVISMAGRAADLVVLGDYTSGSSADLLDCTAIALSRIRCGADPRAPLISLEGFGYHVVPEGLRDEVGRAALAAVREAADRSEAIARSHRSLIMDLARILIARRRLDEDDIAEAFTAVGLVMPDLNARWWSGHGTARAAD